MSDMPLRLPPVGPVRSIDIDAVLVASRQGLRLPAFRALMDHGRIRALCERDTDADAGRYRATFHHHHRRAQRVVDAQGRLLHDAGDARTAGQA